MSPAAVPLPLTASEDSLPDPRPVADSALLVQIAAILTSIQQAVAALATTPAPPQMTIDEAAAYLRLPLGTVRELVRHRRIPYCRPASASYSDGGISTHGSTNT